MNGTSRGRLADICRLVAGVAWLALALALFARPLGLVLAPLVTSPAPGFMASITSAPGGAEVTVDGEPRGATPFFGNVPCREGQGITIEVSRPGFVTWERRLACREGQHLLVRARLER